MQSGMCFFCGQAMYALAASSRQTLVAKGNFVVAEGETGEDSENSLFRSLTALSKLFGEDADALVLLVSGVASVLKKAMGLAKGIKRVNYDPMVLVITKL